MIIIKKNLFVTTVIEANREIKKIKKRKCSINLKKFRLDFTCPEEAYFLNFLYFQ